MYAKVTKQTLKVLVLVITFVCAWLHYVTLYSSNDEDQFAVGGTFVAFLIIGSAAIFEFCVEPFPPFLELYFHIAAIIMFLIATCLSMAYWTRTHINNDQHNILVAKSILCSCNMVLYAISGFMHYAL